MTTLTIGAAQSHSIAGDINVNIDQHLRFMQVAANNGVELLVFPELSLTGYELATACKFALRPGDELLKPLQKEAERLGMVAVVGAPVLASQGTGTYIGALIFGKQDGPSTYFKQHLHSGEDTFFVAGADGLIFQLKDANIAVAICADIVHPEHAARAAMANASIYVASVLITAKAYQHEASLLKAYAAEHRMAVLMANHGNSTGGWESAGQSAIWAEDGCLVASAKGGGDLLVIAKHEQGTWSGKVLNVAP